MGWAGGPSSAAGTGPLSWPCLPLDGGSDAVCPPPSCLRLGVVSVVSFFVLCAPHPSSSFLFIVLIRAGGFVLGRGTMPPPKRTWVAQLPQPRGGVPGNSVTILPLQGWTQSLGWGSCCCWSTWEWDRAVIVPLATSVPTGSSRSITTAWWTMSPRSGRRCWSENSSGSPSLGRRNVG